MEVVQPVEDLQHDVLRLPLAQRLRPLQVGVQISIGTVLQPKDDVVLGLERV